MLPVEVQVQAPRLDGPSTVSKVTHHLAKHSNNRVLVHGILQLISVLNEVKAPAEPKEFIEKPHVRLLTC